MHLAAPNLRIHGRYTPLRMESHLPNGKWKALCPLCTWQPRASIQDSGLSSVKKVSPQAEVGDRALHTNMWTFSTSLVVCHIWVVVI